LADLLRASSEISSVVSLAATVSTCEIFLTFKAGNRKMRMSHKKTKHLKN